MLLLLIRVGEGRYAVDARDVMEVVPRVGLRAIPHAPAFLAGVYDSAGQIVPVIDLGLLFHGTGCPERLSTRIVVVSYPLPGRPPARLGLVAERVSELCEVEAGEVPTGGTGAGQTSYLGPMFRLGGELTQMLRVDALLTAELRDELFGVLLGVE
jgi:chemotaxis-related protein WspB